MHIPRNKLLETHNLPKLNHEEIKTLNKSIIRNKVNSVIKTSSKKGNPWPCLERFASEFYLLYKKTDINP